MLKQTNKQNKTMLRPSLITYTRPSCSTTAPLWSKGANAGRGRKHTLKGNLASSDPTLRASAPATWDLPPHQIVG